MIIQRHSKNSQILPVKRIFSSNNEFEYCKSNLQKELMTHSSSIQTDIKKIRLPDKKEWLTPKTTHIAQMLPLTGTCNRTLSNIKQLIQNHGAILKTDKDLETTFN